MSDRRGMTIAATCTVVLLGLTSPRQAVAQPAAKGTLRHLAQQAIQTGRVSQYTGTQVAAGSDLAFQGDLLVAGAYEGVGFFRILNGPPYLEQISFFNCAGAQGDVSIWGDYVFVSMEHQSAFYTPVTNYDAGPTCNSDGMAAQEGIRIIDISDPSAPRQVKFIPIVCGSHTHTIVPDPDGKSVYLYNSALPRYLIEDYVRYCNRLTIIEFPADDASRAKVIAEPSMDLEIGCHDITAFPDEGIAAAACWTDSFLWDISNPAEPEVISKLPTKWTDGHHAASFTWDGKYVAIGQEAGNCTTRAGEIAFYDIRDRTQPKQVGRFHIPRQAPGSFCWSHNFMVVPTKDASRYVLTAGFYNGGISVVDFSDPRSPREIAFAMVVDEGGRNPEPWGAYWYNGRIYSNDWTSGFGVGAYEMKGLGSRDARSFPVRLNPQLQTRD